MRIELQVPFEDKDKAKKLGARWDPKKKVWYLPEGLDAHLFQQWLPKELRKNFISPDYWIAETISECWKCKSIMPFIGLLLSEKHILDSGKEIDEDIGPIGEEEFHRREEGKIPLGWRMSGVRGMPYYLEMLNPEALERIVKISPEYSIDFNNKAKSNYYMNHCPGCGARQGDFHAYCEPDGPFLPVERRIAERINLHYVQEECSGYAEGQASDPFLGPFHDG